MLKVKKAARVEIGALIRAEIRATANDARRILRDERLKLQTVANGGDESAIVSQTAEALRVRGMWERR